MVSADHVPAAVAVASRGEACGISPPISIPVETSISAVARQAGTGTPNTVGDHVSHMIVFANYCSFSTCFRIPIFQHRCLRLR
ncbi:hypothetical protein BYT27DRAFT_6407755 [Phlegmacium glaucopus]|nr:hypothetical protein BYT27DRAFT_6407755 [Phlegmacium glaucopus]